MVGVRKTWPEMRACAARMSSNAIMRSGSVPAEPDAQDLVAAVAARRGNGDGVADLLADQRLGQRRGDRQPAAFDVGLVHADDLVLGFLLRLLVDQLDVGAELHVVARQHRRVDHLGRGDDLLQLRDAALDERLPLARGVVFGVLREVAVGARLGDLADDGRPLLRLQVPQLVFQALQAGAGHRKLLRARQVLKSSRRDPRRDRYEGAETRPPRPGLPPFSGASRRDGIQNEPRKYPWSGLTSSDPDRRAAIAWTAARAPAIVV